MTKLLKVEDDNGKAKVTLQGLSGVVTHTFNLSVVEFKERHLLWQRGALIQKAFNNISASERELLLTGLNDKEWEKLFGVKEPYESY